MKIIFVFLFLIVFSCRDDDTIQMGCITGEVLGTGVRVPIRCATKKQFEFGSNITAGGTTTWNNYTNHSWSPVSDCTQCE